MMITDDPLHDFYEHDAEEEEWLRKRPICYSCGNHIQDDYGYLYDGNLLCEKCWDDIVRKEIRVDIDNLIDE